MEEPWYSCSFSCLHMLALVAAAQTLHEHLSAYECLPVPLSFAEYLLHVYTPTVNKPGHWQVTPHPQIMKNK